MNIFGERKKTPKEKEVEKTHKTAMKVLGEIANQLGVELKTQDDIRKIVKIVADYRKRPTREEYEELETQLKDSQTMLSELLEGLTSYLNQEIKLIVELEDPELDNPEEIIGSGLKEKTRNILRERSYQAIVNNIKYEDEHHLVSSVPRDLFYIVAACDKLKDEKRKEIFAVSNGSYTVLLGASVYEDENHHLDLMFREIREKFGGKGRYWNNGGLIEFPKQYTENVLKLLEDYKIYTPRTHSSGNLS